MNYYSLYEVKEGDTIYKISKMFNVSPKLISYLNGIKEDDYIYPKDIIKIPKKGIEYYITKEDDTLKIVSGIFRIKEEEIISQNKEIFLLPDQLIIYKE